MPPQEDGRAVRLSAACRVRLQRQSRLVGALHLALAKEGQAILNAAETARDAAQAAADAAQTSATDAQAAADSVIIRYDPDNLIPNGSFVTGDASETEIATNWSVVDSGEPAAVLYTRPTVFILKMPVDAGVIRAATLAENIPARPGDEFQISFDYITEGTTREADLQFYFQFRDVNDGLLGPIFYTVQDANNKSWQRGSDVVTAPGPRSSM
jgi:hypothetical protein